MFAGIALGGVAGGLATYLGLETAVAVGAGVAVGGSAVALSSLLATPEIKADGSSDEEVRRQRKKAKRAEKEAKASKAHDELEAALKAEKEEEDVAREAEKQEVEKAKKKKKAKAESKAAAAEKKVTSAPAPVKQEKKKKAATDAPAPAAVSSPSSASDSESKADAGKKKKKAKKPKTEGDSKGQAAVAPVAQQAPKPEQKASKSSATTATTTSTQSQSHSDDGWTAIKSSRKQASKDSKPKAKESKTEANTDQKETEKSITLEIKVGVNHFSRIIGTGGANLKLLEAAGAKVTLPRREKKEDGSVVDNKNSTQKETVYITGPAAAANTVKKAIEDIVSKGFSNLTDPGVSGGELKVEPKLHGVIIGPGGSHIKAIQAKTGTRINMPDSKAGTGAPNDRINITGSKDSIKAAKTAIRELLELGFSTLTHEGWVKKELAVPRDKLARIIGHKGGTIRHIQKMTDAKIKIPDAGAENQNVIIAGTADAVSRAEKQVLNALEPPAAAAQEDDQDAEVESGFEQVPEEAEW